MQPGTPAAVVRADRVLTCSAAAGEQGVHRGLHRREAQRRCPGLVVLVEDPSGSAVAFERVLTVVERFVPAVEVIRPGVCACRSAGVSRYAGRRRSKAGDRSGDGSGGHLAEEYGNDVDLAGRLAAAVGHGCRVGIADGLFAAGLAARRGLVVQPGATREFLAPWPVRDTLGRPELADLLVRLGVDTLGDFAALPPGAVLSRFGPDGARAHRLARGLEERPLALRQRADGLTVSVELDPPVDRADRAAFAVKALADGLHERLAAHRLVCTRVAIEAVTERGERLVRLWRQDGTPASSTVAERMRWQLDSWISGAGDRSSGRPTSGLVLLRLTADEVTPDDGHQLDLWGATNETDERVARAVARVQGMLGVDAVTTAVPGGGRGPADRITWTVWGEPRVPRLPESAPWPGHIPSPSPATVHGEPVPAEITDGDGLVLAVSGRHALSAPPAWLSVAGGRRVPAVAWAGPWPVDERWWDPAGRRRLARLQVVTADGAARLLALRGGRWWVEAEYD
ncbi:MAG TPA: DNA polymerase Y family protein [Mycobacteriales bacterium]|nr:DNA polymerase Y family protein [Mycobacteriales bacterium]